jgi:hypothetical protein
LAVGKNSVYFVFSFLTKGLVYDQTLTIFRDESYEALAMLQSAIHEEWFSRFGSTIKADRRYSPSACFDTFPFPKGETSDLARVGEKLDLIRSSLKTDLQIGFRKIYSLVHSSSLCEDEVANTSRIDHDSIDELTARVFRLRDVHQELNHAMLNAYGWHEESEDGPAIDLKHDFYEVDYLPENDRVRFTIHPDARREILKRLLLLNHRRHAEEVEAGLHDKKKTATKKKSTAKSAKKVAAAATPLFDQLDESKESTVARSTVIDTAFPSTEVEKLLCACLLESVLAKSDLEIDNYVDAVLLATAPDDCAKLLIGKDRTSFNAAAKRVDGPLASFDSKLPWRLMLSCLKANRALSESDGKLGPGENFEQVRKTYPKISKAFISGVDKAATRLREIQESVTPQPEMQEVAKQISQRREAALK